MGEQPLKPGKVTASNTAAVPKSHDGGRQGKKKAIQRANAVWEWVKGDQPLEPVKKEPRGTNTAKMKRSDKLAMWLRKSKKYGDKAPMQQSRNQRSSDGEDPDHLKDSDKQSAGHQDAEWDPFSSDAERQSYPQDAKPQHPADSSSINMADHEDPPPGYSQPPSRRRNVEIESVSD